MSFLENSLRWLTRKIVNEAYNIIQRNSPTPFSILWAEAAHEAADIIRNNISHSMLFRNVTEIRDYAIANVSRQGLLLEFGVHRALSTNRFARQLKADGSNRTIHGFDSFEGLQEDWTGFFSAKDIAFNRSGRLPKVESNVVLIKGWIDKTLPDFLQSHPDPIAFIHIDTDTYLPASTILKACKHRLAKGALILFDELLGYPNWRNHEYKALGENFDESEYEFIAFANNQALIRILR